MDPEKRQRLRKNHVLLKENLQILPILDRMFAKGTLSDDETDDVRNRSTTPDKCQVFLDYLRRKGNEGYDVFRDILRELQPDILEKVEETVIDRDTLGEESALQIFFDPSEDFELKRLIDELTKDNKITAAQLERMKNMVTGEIGCSEEIIEKKDTPVKFLRHLMKCRLLTRYNLTFLQSLLWNVENKPLCLQVADFARSLSQEPVHFYTPLREAENGYTFGKFHIRGNVDHFKGTSIEDICQRIARYLGVPASIVIPVGVEPSESLVLTIMLPVDVMKRLKSLDNWSWLTDLGVDYIIHGDENITLKEDTTLDHLTEQRIIEKELKRKTESEQHLKQCLYDEQMSNENLKDLQVELEKRLERSEETVKELNTWYLRIFAVLLMSLHFISELIKFRRGLIFPGQDHRIQQIAQTKFLAALEQAKRWSSNHESLMHLVDAKEEVERCKERGDINTMSILSNIALVNMEQNFKEAVTMRMTERSLGVYQRKPSFDEVRQDMIVSKVLFGLFRLEPMLEEIITGLMSKLDEEQLQTICKKFSVPQSLQTPDLKSKIICYVIFSELDKQGKPDGTVEDTDKIIKACFKEAGRKDLWELYRSIVGKRQKMYEEQRKAQSMKERDTNDRLDKIEKMIQTIVGQTMMGGMGMKGSGNKRDSQDPNGWSSLIGGFFKDQRQPFLNYLRPQES